MVVVLLREDDFEEEDGEGAFLRERGERYTAEEGGKENAKSFESHASGKRRTVS